MEQIDQVTVLSVTYLFTLGCTIVSCFERRVGAAGGAAGALLGVLAASRGAARLVGVIRDLEEQKKRKKKAQMTEITVGVSENVKLQVERLKTVKTLCDRMAAVQSV